MMRHCQAAVFGLLVGAASALPAMAQTVTGEPLAVGPFNRIDVSGHAEVVLIQGSDESVTVEGSAKSPARVGVRASEGRLVIDVDEKRDWWGGGPRRPPTIRVRFRTLESLGVSGSIKVTAGAIEVPALRIDASGATTVRVDDLRTQTLRFVGSGAVKARLSGRAVEQTVAISGAGSFRAQDLVSDTAKVSVTGAGRVTVNAQKSLSAEISGAGAIDYYGDPDVRQRVSGAGKITRRSANAGPLRVTA